jgi:hypothetical protein
MRPLDLPTRALFLLAGLVLLAPPAVATGWTPVVPAVRIDTGGGDSRGLPAVVMDESGESVVAWLVFTFPGTFADFSLVARRLSAAGIPAASALDVDAALGASRPSLALDGAGGFRVVSGGYTVMGPAFMGAHFDATDQEVATLDSPLSGPGQTWPDWPQVAQDPDGDGDFLLAWVEDAELRVRRYGADDEQIGDAVVLTGPAGGAFPFDLPCPDGNAGAGPMHPALAADRQGGYLVVWSGETSAGTDQQGRSIQLLRLAADGAPQGDAVQVNDGVAGDQQRPAIAVAPDGRFVVAWDSTVSGGDDDDGCSIQARLFSTDGEPQGGDFQVNDGTQGHQQEPAVAWVRDEAFAIAWTSASSAGDDADGTSVQARLFADTGAPAGPSRQINVATPGNQRVATIASDGAGSVVFAWQDVGTDQVDVALYAVPEPSRAAQALAAVGVLTGLRGMRGVRISRRREPIDP